MYFCGVRPGSSAGHFCEPPSDARSPWGGHGYTVLDWHPERDGLRAPRRAFKDRGRPPEDEGEFVHLVLDGWTLIAAWDRSADHRGGCTATFAVLGVLEAEEMLASAREQYPRVFARIEKHIGRSVTVRRATLRSGVRD